MLDRHKAVYVMRDYFGRLFGNVDTKNRIGRTLEEGNLPHAFLIGGPDGSGKLTLALEIAAALNCERRNDKSAPLPCHSCNSCRRIYEGGFVDVKLLSLREGKSTIGVSEVKDFRADMFLSSTESEYKIYIIKNAEKMTVEAQNALLIVLEEPPKNVIIMLLASECDRILTTIKSRVQYIPMSYFSDDELHAYLVKNEEAARLIERSDPERLSAIIRSADGRIGTAKELLSPKLQSRAVDDRLETEQLISAFSARASYEAIHSALFSLPQKRTELSFALERAISAIRDMIAVRYSDRISLSFFLSIEDAKKAGREIGAQRLFKIYDLILSAHSDNLKNAGTTALLTSLAAQIKLA